MTIPLSTWISLHPSLEVFFYLGKMMNRGETLSRPQDPEVFIRQSPPFQCVYAEGSRPYHNQILKTEGGMDVFIRKK